MSAIANLLITVKRKEQTMSDMMTQEEAMNMSNEQAVQILSSMRNMMLDQYGCPISDAVFAFDKAIEVLSADRPQEWTPCSEGLPKEHEWIGTKRYGTTISDKILITFNADGKKIIDTMRLQNGKLATHNKYVMDICFQNWEMIAWMPLPKPYTVDCKTENERSK